MSTEKFKAMKKLFNDYVDGVELSERKGATFYFPVHLDQKMRESGLEELELSVRSYHCLRRADLYTVGQLAQAIADGFTLTKIRNCGALSRAEIMEKMFFFQLHNIKPEKRTEYIDAVIRLNMEKKGMA